MADGGWSGLWIVGGVVAGFFLGKKLIPWNTRVAETEKLLEIAEEVKILAQENEDVQQQLQTQVIIDEITNYRKGIMEHALDIDDEEHKSVLQKIKSSLGRVRRKLTPWAA